MGRRHCPLGGYSTPNDSSVKWASAPGAYVHGDPPSALPSQVMRGRILAHRVISLPSSKLVAFGTTQPLARRAANGSSPPTADPPFGCLEGRLGGRKASSRCRG